MKNICKIKKILMSVTALALIITLAVGITFSWAEGGNKGKIDGNDIVISTGSSLTMRQDGSPASTIYIPDCVLDEVSSADGRNYFVPLDFNSRDKSNTTAISELIFREGIPEDEGKKYVSLDFQLEAGDNIADVFLGSGTIIQCKNDALLNALRLSFNFNDGTAPMVFKPNQMPYINEQVIFSPITAITDKGIASTTDVETEAFGDYYYHGDDSEPLFSLEKGETKNITLSIWLEGTEFSGASFDNNELKINIDFITTLDDLVEYNFLDNTHGYIDSSAEYWITEKNGIYDTMMYVYDVDTERYYGMKMVEDKVEGTRGSKWTAYVPKTISKFYFRRYSIDIDQYWNQWEPNMGSGILSDPNGKHTYVAICGNGTGLGTELNGAYGYWMDSKDTIRVYFQLETKDWTNTKCYAWGSDEYTPLGSWPGKSMTFSHNAGNSSGSTDPAVTKPVYYVDIEGGSKLTGIQFNNSNDSQKYDLNGAKYCYNGLTMWYQSGDSGKNGTFIYMEEKNSLIYPKNKP